MRKLIIVFTALLFMLPLVSAYYSVSQDNTTTLTITTTNSFQLGIVFKVNADKNGVQFINATSETGDTHVSCYLYNFSSGTLLGSGTITSNNCKLSTNVTLYYGTSYTIQTEADNTKTTKQKTSPAYPYVGGNANITSGAYGITTLDSGSIWVFKAVTTGFPDPVSSNFSVKASDWFSGNSLSNFSATATNASGYVWNASTTNGFLNFTNLLTSSNYLVNLSVTSNQSGGYYTTNYTNINMSAFTYINYFVANLSQVYAYFTATEFISNNSVTGGTFYITNGINSTTANYNSLVNLTAGTYNITYVKSGYFNQTQQFTFNSLSSNYNTISGVYSAIYNVSAINNITGAAISNFPYSVTTSTGTFVTNGTASGTTAQVGLINGSYIINISPSGFAPNSFNFTVSSSGTINVTYSFFSANSIYFYVRNSSSLQLVNTTTSTIRLLGCSSYINTTTNGTLFVSGYTPCSYNVTVSATGYLTSSYTVTVGNNSYQTLNAYLDSASASSTLFTVYDDESSIQLQNSLINVEENINGTYYLISSLYSDISGRAQLYYNPSSLYRFTVSANNYVTKIFTLNPIIFSSYDIRLTRGTSNNLGTALSGISLVINPGTVYNNATNNFSITLANPSGDLQLFNYTVVYKTNTYSNRSTNAYGATLTIAVPIANATVADRVYLYYQYIGSDGNIYAFTKVYSIETAATTGSFAGISNNQFNMALLDRVIILVLVTGIIAGLGMTMGGLAVGGLLGLATLGYFGAIGFVTLWVIVPSMVLLGLFTLWGVASE